MEDRTKSPNDTSQLDETANDILIQEDDQHADYGMRPNLSQDMRRI